MQRKGRISKGNVARRTVAIYLLLVLLSACSKDKGGLENEEIGSTIEVSKYDNRAIRDWQNIFLVIERNASGYNPCPTSRAMAYLGLGAYESCISGMSQYKSIAYLYPGLRIPLTENGKNYHYPTVLNNLNASLFKRFFVNIQVGDKIKIDSVETALNTLYQSQSEPDVFELSKAYGLAVADAIWSYSQSDLAGHDKYNDPSPIAYSPPVGVGYWKPTPPLNQPARFPYWGSVKTFAILGSEKLCLPPIPYSTNPLSLYYAESTEVLAHTSPQTPDEQWIAEFWCDDVFGFTFSQPARWISITSQILEIENSNLETALLAAVKVGIAVNDATVGAWYSKYNYSVERPITFIHEVMANNTWSIVDLTSTGFINSPPAFPTYPSSHATVGAAAATALTAVFGTTYSFTDRSHQNRQEFNGTPRSYSSFYEMAEENAKSRIYLGMNFPMDCSEGMRFGYFIGQRVNALPFKK